MEIVVDVPYAWRFSLIYIVLYIIVFETLLPSGITVWHG